MIERDDRGVVKPDKMQISFGGGIEKLKSNEFLPEGFSIIEEWREHFQLDEIPHDRTKCFPRDPSRCVGAKKRVRIAREE